MPTSKQARARQARQKERLAVLQADREHRRSRRRRIGAGVVAFLLIIGVILAIAGSAIVGSDDKKKATAASAASTTTAASGAQFATCAGLKDTLPKGAPPVPLVAGPAPQKLETRDITVGTGPVVPKNAKVVVNYVGVGCSGKIFDSSYSRNQPFDADLSGGVIDGWQQGIPGMRVGGTRLLSIPAALAYKAAGSPPAIAPNEPIFFLVAVKSITS